MISVLVKRAAGFKCKRLLSTSSSPTHKKVIFSGIQPTGIPHLGNYLGALQGWVHQQNNAKDDETLIYSLVDLHAITVKQHPTQLRQWRKESLAVLLAIGLDPKRSTIFFQSHVPAHSELMWILSCTASVGYLSRMTQWKSKMSVEDNAKPFDTPLQLGLFSYPVLQAADILVHRATHVPVGEDQSQHLEFTRTCAAGFNNIYGKVLVQPETVLSPAKRVMSLTNPEKKMSKSDSNPKSRIVLTDSADIITKKVNSALADSIDGVTFDSAGRPGLSNLLQILCYLENSTPSHSLEGQSTSPAELASDLSSLSKRALKERVAKSIDEHLAPIRNRFHEIMEADGGRMLDDIAREGGEKARLSALKTISKVKHAVGLL